MRPIGIIVTKPVANVAAGACKGAASYDQRSETGATVEHGAATCLTHHRAKEVVSVVFGQAIGVDKIGVDGQITEGTSFVVDGIWRGKKIAVWQPHFGACSSNLSLYEGSPHAAGVGGLEVCGESGNWVACIRADCWDWRWITIRGGESCWVTAWIGAEVGGFVHVNPKCIDVNAISWAEEAREFAVPIALGGWVEPVWKSGNTRPDNP